MNNKEILKRLDEEEQAAINECDGDKLWLINTLRKTLAELAVLKTPTYSDCSIPTSYCSNCSCGKKEALGG
jgi:hypothetical protein